jgi:hypothetical protein
VAEPPTVGWRLLTFLDDTQVRLKGLDEIMSELYYQEKRPDNEKTAEEIIQRLEDKNNYIPSSDRTRREYAYVLLKEYRKYVKDRTKQKINSEQSFY